MSTIQCVCRLKPPTDLHGFCCFLVSLNLLVCNTASAILVQSGQLQVGLNTLGPM